MAVIEVVKYNDSPDVLAWKYPGQELGTWTQLIVNDSQEAVLFKSGKATDVFGGGRHTLSTANIPFLNKIINLPFGSRSPFTAEVWYINKLHTLDIKWGTPSPIQIQDPKYGILTPVRAYGQFGIKIDESRKFLAKLVGTLPNFDKGSLVNYFRGIYIAKAKDTISSYLVHKKISMVEINAYLDELSGHIKERIKPVMAEYGIELLNFYVNDVNMPENDPSVIQLKEALAKRAKMDIVGYDYGLERTYDTLEGAATNQGSAASGLLGAGMGMGMGVTMGGSMGRQFDALGQVLGTNSRTTVSCAQCRRAMPRNSKFCPHCGHDAKNDRSNAAITCDKCGAALHEGAKFCPECGDIYNPCSICGADLPVDASKCTKCGFVLPQKCPACSEPVGADAKFCPNCGRTLKKTCASCQTELADKAKFCPNCGKAMTDRQGD